MALELMMMVVMVRRLQLLLQIHFGGALQTHLQLLHVLVILLHHAGWHRCRGQRAPGVGVDGGSAIADGRRQFGDVQVPLEQLQIVLEWHWAGGGRRAGLADVQ